MTSNSDQAKVTYAEFVEMFGEAIPMAALIAAQEATSPNDLRVRLREIADSNSDPVDVVQAEAVEAAARAMCDRVNGTGDYDENVGQRRRGWMAQARAGIAAYLAHAAVPSPPASVLIRAKDGSVAPLVIPERDDIAPPASGERLREADDSLVEHVARAIADAVFLQSDSGVYPKWSDYRDEARAAIRALAAAPPQCRTGGRIPPMQSDADAQALLIEAYGCESDAIEFSLADEIMLQGPGPALRAIQAVLDGVGWQDITTAPRDGTLILGGFFRQPWADSHRQGEIVRCWWQPEFEAFISSAREMTLAPGYTFDNGSARKLHSPVIEAVSHWMPLPKAPPALDAKEVG
jgi:hypothetical protein